MFGLLFQIGKLTRLNNEEVVYKFEAFVTVVANHFIHMHSKTTF